jgi:hypothetical protein
MVHDDFFDPKGELRHRARVRGMTLLEALRLRTKDGYRIRRIRVLLRVCAVHNIGAWVEPKDDERFELDWPWRHMRKVSRRFGVRLRARAIKNFPTRHAGLRRVRAARRNNIRANTI